MTPGKSNRSALDDCHGVCAPAGALYGWRTSVEGGVENTIRGHFPPLVTHHESPEKKRSPITLTHRARLRFWLRFWWRFHDCGKLNDCLNMGASQKQATARTSASTRRHCRARQTWQENKFERNTSERGANRGHASARTPPRVGPLPPGGEAAVSASPRCSRMSGFFGTILFN